MKGCSSEEARRAERAVDALRPRPRRRALDQIVWQQRRRGLRVAERAGELVNVLDAQDGLVHGAPVRRHLRKMSKGERKPAKRSEKTAERGQKIERKRALSPMSGPTGAPGCASADPRASSGTTRNVARSALSFHRALSCPSSTSLNTAATTGSARPTKLATQSIHTIIDIEC